MPGALSADRLVVGTTTPSDVVVGQVAVEVYHPTINIGNIWGGTPIKKSIFQNFEKVKHQKLL